MSVLGSRLSDSANYLHIYTATNIVVAQTEVSKRLTQQLCPGCGGAALSDLSHYHYVDC